MVTPSHITRGIALINIDDHSLKNDPQLLAEDGNVYAVYSVKKTDINKHRESNRFFCFHFLNIWNLNTPKMSVIHAPPSIFNGLKQTHPITKTPIANGRICLGFKIQREELTFNPLIDDVHYWTYKAFSNPLDFLKLALFDGWIGNDGRKESSIDLFFITDKNRKLKLFTRNHELTFGDIPYQNLSKNYRNRAHFSILKLKIVRKIISMYNLDALTELLSDYYINSINNVLASMKEIFKLMPENFRITLEEQSKIREYIGNADRNERVFEEFMAIVRP